MTLDRNLGRDSFKTLFRRTGVILRALSEEELVPIDAAVIDIPEAVRRIQDRILPEIATMIGDGVVNNHKLFDLIMEMKVQLDHVQFHLTHAIPAVDKLLTSLSQMEKERKM